MMEGLRRKRLMVGAVAVAALAGGGAAIAGTQLGSNEDEQAIIDDAAQRLGVEPAELSDALEQAHAARIDAAVAAGELTEERAAELKQRLEEGDVPLVGGALRGPGGHHGFGHHGPGLLGGLDAAATYLGLDEDALRERLAGGDSLADVATAEGKTVDGLKQAITADVTADLDAAVADGRLTDAQKQEVLDDLAARVDDLVARTGLPGPPGHGHGFRGGFDRGFPEDGPPADATEPASATF